MKHSLFLRKLGIALFAFFLMTRVWAQEFPSVEFLPYVSGLASPLDIIGSPFGNSDMYVVQRGVGATNSAQIRVISNGAVLAAPFLTVTGISCCNERGLLSMVFHPDVATNGTFFVWYTAITTGNLTLARYKLMSTDNYYEADPDSRQIMLSIPHSTNSNHNGGKLLFGPDGYLYIGTGDGGGPNDPPNNAQNPQSLLGKILRINPLINSTAEPHYTIPADNPYANGADGVLDEIYSIGVRNPWRWSFDKITGNAWIADVGQANSEELNMVTPTALKGANFGWRCFEGTLLNNASGVQPCSLYNGQAHTLPVFEYPHDEATGGFSVTGGYVYRGNAYPRLSGFYILADYVTPAIWLVKTNGPFESLRQTDGVPSNISGFGETANNELWALSLTEGTVYSVKTVEPLSANPISLSGKINGNHHTLEWKTGGINPSGQFELQHSVKTEGPFSPLTYIPVRAETENNYTIHLRPASISGTIFYRLKVESGAGDAFYSNVLALEAISNINDFYLARQGNRATVFLSGPAKELLVTDITGRRLYASKFDQGVTTFTFQIPQNHNGILVLMVRTQTGSSTWKILSR